MAASTPKQEKQAKSPGREPSPPARERKRAAAAVDDPRTDAARAPGGGTGGAKAGRGSAEGRRRVRGATPPAVLPERERGPVALGDLRLQDCRWPLGAANERVTLFCGKPHQPGSPYCAEHHARSVGRG